MSTFDGAISSNIFPNTTFSPPPPSDPVTSATSDRSSALTQAATVGESTTNFIREQDALSYSNLSPPNLYLSLGSFSNLTSPNSSALIQSSAHVVSNGDLAKTSPVSSESSQSTLSLSLANRALTVDSVRNSTATVSYMASMSSSSQASDNTNVLTGQGLYTEKQIEEIVQKRNEQLANSGEDYIMVVKDPSFETVVAQWRAAGTIKDERIVRLMEQINKLEEERRAADRRSLEERRGLQADYSQELEHVQNQFKDRVYASRRALVAALDENSRLQQALQSKTTKLEKVESGIETIFNSIKGEEKQERNLPTLNSTTSATAFSSTVLTSSAAVQTQATVQSTIVPKETPSSSQTEIPPSKDEQSSWWCVIC